MYIFLFPGDKISKFTEICYPVQNFPLIVFSTYATTVPVMFNAVLFIFVSLNHFNFLQKEVFIHCTVTESFFLNIIPILTCYDIKLRPHFIYYKVTI